MEDHRKIAEFASWIFAFVCCGALWGDIESSTGGDKYQNLIDRNPFYVKPPARPAEVLPTQSANYDFTGFVTVGDVVQVGIFDKTKQVGYLLKVGQTQATEDNSDDLTIEQFDTETSSVTLKTRSQSIKLSLANVSTSDGTGMTALSPPPWQPSPGMPYPGSMPGAWPPGMPSPVPQPNWNPGMPQMPGGNPFPNLPFTMPGMSPTPAPNAPNTVQSGQSQPTTQTTPRPRIRRPIRVPSKTR
jgi:hypothetical protein